jgi:protein SCO1
MMPRALAVPAAALLLGVAVPGLAAEDAAPGRPASETPSVLRDVGFDQKLGATVPLDIPLRDESGAAVRLRAFFGKKPVVLNLVYYDCPMLCNVSMTGLASALDVLTLDPGKDFEIVTVSFDPREGPAEAAARKKRQLERYKRSGAAEGWHFLTGDAPALHSLTQAVGFRYVWDQASRQFAHPAGVVVLTPEGRIARYLFGIEYAPRDLRLALVEASAGRVGTAVDQVFLFCYRYDPSTGRYSAAILRIVRGAAVLTVLGLLAFILAMRRRERAAAAAGTV